MTGYKSPQRKAPAQLKNASGFFLKDSLQDNGKGGMSATLRTISGDVTVTSTQLHRRGEFEMAVQTGAKASTFGEMTSDRKAMTLNTMTTQDPLASIRDTPFEDAAQKVEADRRLLTSFEGKFIPDSFSLDRQGKASATLITPAGPLTIQTMDMRTAEDLETAALSGSNMQVMGNLSEDQGRVSLHMHKAQAAPELVVENPFETVTLDAELSREEELAL